MGLDKPGGRKDVEMKRESRSGEFQAARDDASGKAFGSILNQQAENGQARFLRQGRE